MLIIKASQRNITKKYYFLTSFKRIRYCVALLINEAVQMAILKIKSELVKYKKNSTEIRIRHS